jgi:hypothetical protein
MEQTLPILIQALPPEHSGTQELMDHLDAPLKAVHRRQPNLGLLPWYHPEPFRGEVAHQCTHAELPDSLRIALPCSIRS